MTQLPRILPVVVFSMCTFLVPGFTGYQASAQSASDERLHVLFLGDNGHHQPAMRALDALPHMSSKGIHMVYTDHLEDLNDATLSRYDVLLLFGNNPRITPEQERALFNFVEQGGGLVPVHAGIAMFSNSDAYYSLVGATFKSHGEGTFSTRVVQPDHPAIQGLDSFESWDETYVHMRHNPDKTVLSVQEENGYEEPWTWVRTHGDGRVFYTAWGHDERTWTNPGFLALLERGIRWAAGDWALSADWAPPELEYVEGAMPNYPAGEGWGVTGDPITEVQVPLSPDASLEQTFVEPGFRLELFAAEPNLVNPIDMDWDERGRLWVVESLDYPNTFSSDREGNDRVKILEDTDGDGRADKTTIFADGLNIPTSLVLSNGGVIVAQVPDMLFLKDEDGDDVADTRTVLFTGWGTFDTHAGPNNLRYGLDNHVWGAVGYSSFNGAVGEDSIRFGQALYRFAPDGSTLEHMATFNNNTWGLTFSEEGYVFGSTANKNPSLHAAIPERYYNRLEGDGPHVLRSIADASNFYPITDRVRQVDQHGHYTSGAGYELYTARAFPKSYWNRVAFIGGPTGHLLGKFAHEKDGSGFKAHNEGSMVASRDEWFSPIHARVGPDGAVWIIDWYNLIIQHNPTPPGFENGPGNAYEIDLRDRAHSRIYRLVHEDMDSGQTMNLSDASDAQLLDALQSDNKLWRTMAQRFIVEGGKKHLVPELLALIDDESMDELGLNTGAIHAIWALEGLGAVKHDQAEVYSVLFDAIYHPSAGVRRAALMVLPKDGLLLSHILKAGLLPDPTVPEDMDYTVGYSQMDAADATLSLASLLAIADMPASELAGRTAAYAFQVPEYVQDPHLRTALTVAGMQHSESFLPEALHFSFDAEQDSSFTANVKHVVSSVARAYASNGNSSSVSEILMAIKGAEEELSLAVIESLKTNWVAEAPVFSTEKQSELKSLAADLPTALQRALGELAVQWNADNLFE
ncbi:MAG: ThuA domain-containing protein [Rhodothermaceae bacterium]|nr:ThuA domain-containing protein [Rhodothermaceae bacterium]